MGEQATAGSTGLYNFTVPSGGLGMNGNLLSIRDAQIGGWTFVYDSLNRLSSANGIATTRFGGSSGSQLDGQSIGWSYDGFGNQYSQTSTPLAGYPNVFSTHEHNNALNGNNQFAALGYDAAGNMLADGVNSYYYDGLDRICEVKSGITGDSYANIYDASGHRVAKSIQSSFPNQCQPIPPFASETVLGTNGEQFAEYTPSGGWATNVFANGELIATYKGTNLYFALNDWQGTKRVVADVNAGTGLGQYVAGFSNLPFGDDFGSDTGAADPSSHHFTGQLHDPETNLDFFGARHYAPVLGRFMSPDDPDNDRDPSDPQSPNLYAYGRNNPLTNTDPTGEACVVHGDGSRTDDLSGGQSCAEVAAADAQNPASVTVTAKPGNAVESFGLNSAMALSNMAGDYFFGLTGLRAYQNDPLANDFTGKGANIGVNVAGMLIGPEGETGETIKITEQTLKHVTDGHTVGGVLVTAKKSVFNAGTDIVALIKKAETTIPETLPNGDLRFTVDAGQTIGTDRAVGSTSKYTVVTDSARNLITAHPGSYK